MRLTEDEVRHIALLARVAMSDEEVEVMRGHLSNILDHFDVLQQVDTEGVEPTRHSADVESVMREDRVDDSLSLDEAMANAPQRKGDLIRVRAVLE